MVQVESRGVAPLLMVELKPSLPLRSLLLSRKVDETRLSCKGSTAAGHRTLEALQESPLNSGRTLVRSRQDVLLHTHPRFACSGRDGCPLLRVREPEIHSLGIRHATDGTSGTTLKRGPSPVPTAFLLHRSLMREFRECAANRCEPAVLGDVAGQVGTEDAPIGGWRSAAGHRTRPPGTDPIQQNRLNIQLLG